MKKEVRVVALVFSRRQLSDLTMALSKYDTRVLIQDLYDAGIQKPSIISERARIPLSTCYRVVGNIESGKGIERQEGSGRQKIFTNTDRQRLRQVVIRNRRASARFLKDELFQRGSPEVCTRTMQRELKSLGYTKKVGIPQISLTQGKKNQRVQWCLQHQNTDWSNVIFSDESSVWLHPPAIKIWSSAHSKARYERPRHCPKFHLWGGVCEYGPTPLCIFTENLTAQGYINILEQYLLPTAQTLYENDWILQQDNDPKHRARITQQWFLDENVTVMDWPSYSPDLNPIENIWGTLKKHLMSKKFVNIDDMKAETENYWNAMSLDFIGTFVWSMPARIAACLHGNGEITKY